MKYFVFLFFSLMFPFFVVDNVQAQCLLRDSIYTAVNNSEFKLEFIPYQNSDFPYRQNSDLIFATSSITHPTRGDIFSFEATRSMGYGILWFIKNRTDYSPVAYAVYRFDSNFESYDGSGSPPYLLIDGLGSSDYYYNSDRGGRDIYLGDTMWKFSHCNS